MDRIIGTDRTRVKQLFVWNKKFKKKLSERSSYKFYKVCRFVLKTTKQYWVDVLEINILMINNSKNVNRSR